MKKLLVIAVVTLSFSCSSEGDKETILSNEDYFPNTTGTTWTYDGPFEGTMIVTGERKEFDGKIYTELMSDGAISGASYLFKNSGDYYLRGFGGLGDVDLLALKDDVNEGTTWTQNITYQGTKAKVTYTLSAKNITETVEGEEFENVIVVQAHVTSTALGIPLDVADLSFHFGKGVGMIKIETDYEAITGLEGFNGATELVDYTIE